MGIQRYTRVYMGVQGFRRVSRGTQGYTEVYRGTKGDTEVYKDLWGILGTIYVVLHKVLTRNFFVPVTTSRSVPKWQFRFLREELGFVR